MKDAESLRSGQTNKKDDSQVPSYLTSVYMNYARDFLNRQSTVKFIVPLTVVFALIGMVSVTDSLVTYARGQGSSDQGNSESKVTVDLPLETRHSNNDIFDGHIRMDQVHSVSRLSKLVGVEPFGGPKTIEKVMENVADVDSPLSPDDIPLLWEVGGAHSSNVDEICQCLNINVATANGNNEAGNPGVLEPIQVPEKSCKVYNVNLGTHEGTARAKRNGFISKVVPDFVSTPFLPEVASLFTSKHKARLIVSIPNTKLRIGASYDYLTRKGLFTGSILQFASSNHILANNYLTRVLSGKWSGVQDLTEEDLVTAVNVLKQNAIVASAAYHRQINEYIVTSKQWDKSSLDCMYPPTNGWAKEPAIPRPPPPEKTPDEIALEAVIELHNFWDNRLFAIISEQGPSAQLASIG